MFLQRWRIVHEHLSNAFPNRWIENSGRTRIVWSTRSPDLTPYDFFLRYLEQLGYYDIGDTRMLLQSLVKSRGYIEHFTKTQWIFIFFFNNNSNKITLNVLLCNFWLNDFWCINFLKFGKTNKLTFKALCIIPVLPKISKYIK